MEKALEGVLWVEDFSLPLTLFLQGTLMKDKDTRPGAAILLKHPFINLATERDNSSLLCMRELGGLKALDATDEFILVRSVDGNLYAADPLEFSKPKGLHDYLSEVNNASEVVKVTAMAAHKDKLALGLGDGRVQLWVVKRELDEGSPYCNMEKLSEHENKGGGPVAWLALNEIHLVCTDRQVKVLDISQREMTVVWSHQMKNHPSCRECSLMLSSQSAESESILTWAEKARVTQYVLGKTVDPNEYSPKETRLEKDFVLPQFKPGNDPIVQCIAASSTPGEHDLLWIATRNPATVFTKVNLRENKILVKFFVRGGCCQMVHLGDLLLCHMENQIEVWEEGALPKVDSVKDKRGGNLPEPEALDRFRTGVPRIHALKDRFALYVDDNDVLKHYSKEMADKKKKALQEQQQAREEGQKVAKK